MPLAGAGVVTVIVPVGCAHVGCCVALAAGAAGAEGAASTVTSVAGDIHPSPVFTVTLYPPGVTPLNTPVVLV